MQLISSYILPIMLVFSFAVIWIIGASGVTKIMGSPMGASIMSSKQAVVISAVFGLTGVLLSGHHVSATYGNMVFLDVAKDGANIAKTLLVFVVTVFLWILIARRKAALFSCSYTVVCSFVGSFLFGLGQQAINWLLVGEILLAWLVSPFINYFLTIFVYRIFHNFVKKADSDIVMRKAGPIAVLVFVCIFSFIVFYGGVSISTEKPSFYLLLAVPLFFGLVFYILSVFAIRKIPHGETDDSMIAESNTEILVKPLALIIVFVLPFSLGANNVANGIGPLLLSLQLDAANIPASIQSPSGWLLLAGGLVFLSGLVFSGFRLMNEMGRKFTELTPVRSFSIITATSATIMTGTSLGIPLSTFHITAGGVLAFSYLATSYGDTEKIELGRFVGSFFTPWFLTIPGTIVIAGLLHLLANIILT